MSGKLQIVLTDTDVNPEIRKRKRKTKHFARPSSPLELSDIEHFDELDAEKKRQKNRILQK